MKAVLIFRGIGSKKPSYGAAVGFPVGFLHTLWYKSPNLTEICSEEQKALVLKQSKLFANMVKIAPLRATVTQ